MYKILKRLLDLLIAGITFLIFLPLFIPVIIGLRLTGEGYVFYFQKRIGHNSKPFDIWKFVTMLKDSPNIGSGMITVRKDPRITPMGGFLRKTKINELPQIINVFKGNMSIVGPRPTVAKHYNAYPKEIGVEIYKSKPGITGIGSVIFRDEEELISNSRMEPFEYYENVIIPYKGALELWYKTKASILVDIGIIFLTAWVIIFPKSKLPYQMFEDLPKRPF
jgi:lipopolysaccharide/colanic/teichoic acid biosynthesis glycosyltransferase